MRTEIIPNKGRVSMGSEIAKSLGWSASARIASAFVTLDGLRLLEDRLESGSRRKQGPAIRLLFGISQQFTPPGAVNRILKLQRDFPRAFFARVGRNNRFHWKLYIFQKGDRQTSYIGSSNLTGDGMTASGEVSLKLAGRASAKLSRALMREFDAVWHDDRESFPVDRGFASGYNSLRRPTRNLINPDADKKMEALLKPPTRLPWRPTVNARRPPIELVNEFVTPDTEEIVHTQKNSWERSKWEWICYEAKSHRDRASSAGSFLIVVRKTQASKRYYLEFVQTMETAELETEDGNYFLAYKRVPRGRRLSWSKVRAGLSRRDIGLTWRQVKKGRVLKSRQLEELCRLRIVPRKLLELRMARTQSGD